MPPALLLREDALKLLEDNQWHCANKDVQCSCTQYLHDRTYTCKRQDGRLLSINERDLVTWYGGVENLKDVPGVVKNGACPPVSCFEAKPFSENKENLRENAGSLDDRAATEEFQKDKPDRSECVLAQSCGGETSKQGQTKTGTTLQFTKMQDDQIVSDSDKIANLKIQQAVQKQKLIPPCHCEVCSKLFWLTEQELLYETNSDRQKVLSDVSTRAQNAVKKSEQIAQRFSQHGKTLRKRWSEKFTSAKKLHMKLLNDVHATIVEQRRSYELRETPGQRRMGRALRDQMLTFALHPQGLTENPEVLFTHLEARSKHPSQLSYSDFHCMRSASIYGPPTQSFYVPCSAN